jgi:membrane-bound serine protease (ClpP class)
MMGMLVMFLLSSKAFASSKAFNKMVLQESMNANQGYVTHRETEITVGDIGISKSLLRPSGKIEVNNKVYTASSESGYIEADENIVVTKVDVGIWVKKV